MTLIDVVLLGASVLLIASALDNTPIPQTFQKIVSGQPINWAGTGEVAAQKPGTVKGGIGEAPVGNSTAVGALLGGAPPTTTPHKS